MSIASFGYEPTRQTTRRSACIAALKEAQELQTSLDRLYRGGPDCPKNTCDDIDSLCAKIPRLYDIMDELIAETAGWLHAVGHAIVCGEKKTSPARTAVGYVEHSGQFALARPHWASTKSVCLHETQSEPIAFREIPTSEK